jgi:hypothetical protein
MASPRPGAAVFAGRGRIDLGKGFEEPFCLSAGIPMPVSRTSKPRVNAPSGPVPGPADADKDLSLFGKLHRITDQVGQDLAQAEIVAPDKDRHLSFHLVEQLDACTGGTGAEDVEDMFDTALQVENLLLPVPCCRTRSSKNRGYR